eukprot:1137009-Pelagomonas_calceolata.AAC.4
MASMPHTTVATLGLPSALCGAPDSTSHTLLRCPHPHINRMNINCHHQALSICGEALSKGDFGP